MILEPEMSTSCRILHTISRSQFTSLHGERSKVEAQKWNEYAIDDYLVQSSSRKASKQLSKLVETEV